VMAHRPSLSVQVHHAIAPELLLSTALPRRYRSALPFAPVYNNSHSDVLLSRELRCYIVTYNSAAI